MKAGRVMPVHKHQPVAGQFRDGSLVQRPALDAVGRRLASRIERQFHDRGDVREAPVFVLKRGKALLGEARNARLAQREQPRRLLRLRPEPLELLQILFRSRHGFISRMPKSERLIVPCVARQRKPDATKCPQAQSPARRERNLEAGAYSFRASRSVNRWSARERSYFGRCTSRRQ